MEPFFLRRTKEDVGMVGSGDSPDREESSGKGGGAKYVLVLTFLYNYIEVPHMMIKVTVNCN